MTKSQYLELCEARWNEIKELEKATNLYDLEKDFDQTWRSLGGQVLENSLGELPKDKRKKKR